MSNGTRQVVCRTVLGARQEIAIEDVNEFQTPGARLSQQLVRVKGAPFVRKYVPAALGARLPALYALLDNEIRAGCRLAQAYGANYPSELAHLVAYNVDAEEPFALFHEYRGVALGPGPRFDDDEIRQFELGLLRALQYTSAAGVVHGSVGPDALRWNAGHVQLVDFESAERVGEPRRPSTTRVRSPEQTAGTGLVSARDDVWAAGHLIRVTRLQARPGDQLPDHRHDPEGLRTVLSPVFDNPVDHRPEPVELLRRLRDNTRFPVPDDLDVNYSAGRERFEQVSLAKRLQLPNPSANGGKPAKRGKRVFPFLGTMLLVACAIITAAVTL
ncbi:serine/threonine protein kinase [Actinokineospora inagensis]|uniref:serine/threonine protein kinase n=1 Tax=Actinokineospora inagensis TaxID=103730 RepID=UPI00047A4484|nr:serine/threonine protein kinase [Actinokineospora inagensis]